MKIGVIGHRNHAKKIITILHKRRNIKKIKIFIHRKYNKNKSNFKSKKIEYVYSLENLNDISSVFISSPTKTHTKYIKFFLNKKIYIFCEKPGGNGIKDLNFLQTIKTKRRKEIYFNYNLLFTKQTNLIRKMLKNTPKFGKLSFIDIKLTNGISYKKELNKNWRFVSKNIFDQITGNLGSHYINLFLWLFKSVEKKNIFKLKINKKNDTSLIVLKAKKKIIINMYFSYSNPLSDELNLYFSNSILKIKDNKMSVFGPRDHFDKNKFFISPPTIQTNKINQNNEYFKSLELSIDFFLNKVKNNEKFSLEYFKNSINTLKFFI